MKSTQIPSFTVRYNSHNYCIIEIDAEADPDKRDPAWRANERTRYATERMWQQQMCRNWTFASGEPFYPEFAAKRNQYVHKIPFLCDGIPIVRGYDFGFRRPACMFLQKAANGRVAFLRELIPSNIPSEEFRDLVLYVSGQIPWEALADERRVRAMQVVNEIKKLAWTPPLPWFEADTQFSDFAGPECNYTHSVASAKKERSDFEVFRAGGIRLQVNSVRVSAREAVFRRLLQVAPDGIPWMVVDPACKHFIDAMAGRLAYPGPSPANPLPQEPAKDGFYDNLHDAAGYPLVKLVPVVDTPTPPKSGKWVGRTYREDRPVGPGIEKLDIHEAVEW